MAPPVSLPHATKQAARARLRQRLAANILQAMAEVNIDFATLDRVTGQPVGWSQRFVQSLIKGKGMRDLDVIADFGLALQKEAIIGFIDLRPHPG